MTEKFYVGAILQNREGKYLVAEHVKKTPTFSKNGGNISMSLFVP